MYCDANNLYGWAMTQKLVDDVFEWRNDQSKFDESFIKLHSKKSDKWHIFEIDVKYFNHLHNLHNNLPFLRERMDIKKFLKVVWNLCNKQKYSVHIRTLKQALNHGLTLKQVRRIIGFNQKM